MTEQLQAADEEAQERINACSRAIANTLKEFQCSILTQLETEAVGSLGSKLQVTSTFKIAALRVKEDTNGNFPT